MDSLQRLLDIQARGEQVPQHQKPSPEKNDELRELSEMLNQNELATIRRFGGRMHRENRQEEDEESISSQQPRLLIKDPNTLTPPLEGASGKLSGIYQNVRMTLMRKTTLTQIVPPGSALSFPSHTLRESLTTCTGSTPVTLHEQNRRFKPRSRRAHRSTSRRSRSDGQSKMGQ